MPAATTATIRMTISTPMRVSMTKRSPARCGGGRCLAARRGLPGRLGRRCAEHEPAPGLPVDPDRLALPELSGQELHGERVLDLALDQPLQRPRSVGGVVPL